MRDQSVERFTPNTHGSRKLLMADIAQVAQRGWAIDDEEHTIGMRCVSAAILNEYSEPAGAVSISAPTVRMPPERMAVVGDRVRATALTLTELFSGRRRSKA